MLVRNNIEIGCACRPLRLLAMFSNVLSRSFSTHRAWRPLAAFEKYHDNTLPTYLFNCLCAYFYRVGHNNKIMVLNNLGIACGKAFVTNFLIQMLGTL